jgi:hypothetical protein
MVNQLTTPEFLEAIRARIHGDFDNPALIKWGQLTTNTHWDIDAMCKEALKAWGPE